MGLFLLFSRSSVSSMSSISSRTRCSIYSRNSGFFSCLGGLVGFRWFCGVCVELVWIGLYYIYSMFIVYLWYGVVRGSVRCEFFCLKLLCV